MENIRTTSFVVDIGQSMVNNNKIMSNQTDNQKLFCKCGAENSFSAKLQRSVIRNYDTTLEDRESLEKIKCKSCKAVYDYNNKILLLLPEKDELFYVNYEFSKEINHKNETIDVLTKVKNFAKYNSTSGVLEVITKKDFIKFNRNSNKIIIFLNNPSSDENSLGQTLIDSNNKSDFNICETISLSKLNRISVGSNKSGGIFFKYFEHIQYENLDVAFEFLKNIDPLIKDLEELKTISFIKHIYNNNKIESEIKEGGKVNYYQMRDSGFGEGKLIKKNLNIGNYLMSLSELSKVYFSTISFPNITTIYLTKGEKFFFDFLNNDSSNTCNPNVYACNDATFPTKIIEVSTNYERNGSLRNVSDKKNKNVDFDTYFKISPIIYKHIISPADMNILREVYVKNIISKNDMELFLQTYPGQRLYKLFYSLNSRGHNDVTLSIKNLHHILKHKIDSSDNSDFLTIYCDTVRTINLLELEPGFIYKVKDFKSLKEMHDDLSARYNAIKDMKKAEFYLKAVSEFKFKDTLKDDIKFSVVENLENLNREGLIMSHCIYTYLNRICEKTYLAVNVKHTISNERATMGLIRNGKKLSFEQLKGYQNSRASKEMIEAVIKFCKTNDIEISNSGDLSISENLRKKMSDYLSDEEVAKIRKERSKKIKNGEILEENENKSKKNKGFFGGLINF